MADPQVVQLTDEVPEGGEQDEAGRPRGPAGITSSKKKVTGLDSKQSLLKNWAAAQIGVDWTPSVGTDEETRAHSVNGLDIKRFWILFLFATVS